MLMRTMTSCVVQDDVMTSLVVDLILMDSLSRQSCVMSAPWYLRECRLRHCVDEDDDELRVRSKHFDGRKTVKGSVDYKLAVFGNFNSY